MTQAPGLHFYMNLMAFDSLPENSAAPRGTREEQFEGIREAGFEGVQFAGAGSVHELSFCRSAGLGFAGSGRINRPSEAKALAAEAAGSGYDCLTLHLGWGIESNDEAFRLIESVLEAALQTHLPLYIETHRATICQDMWRTVEFVKRFPDMRFNGDFSHWYAGQEMVYGGFEPKLRYIQPVVERVRFIHGRIADAGCIQVPVQEGSTCLLHFEEMWTACFGAYLQTEPERMFCFTPELLSPAIHYARTVNGFEITDRWDESLLLIRIADKCFLNAATRGASAREAAGQMDPMDTLGGLSETEQSADFLHRE
jgi:hypothetical protein